MVAKTEKKTRENKTRQVQLVLKQSLIDAVKDKAKWKTSFNAAASEAIDEYIRTDGEDIPTVKTKRAVLFLQPSQYERLSYAAKAQGISVTEAVTHALEEYAIGEKLDHTEGWMITYAGMTAALRSKVDRMGEIVNGTCGGLEHVLNETAEKLKTEASAAKKEDAARIRQAEKSVRSVCKSITEMDKAVTKIKSEDDYIYPQIQKKI